MDTTTEAPPLEEGGRETAPTGDRFLATTTILLAAVLFGYQVLILEFVPPLAVFGGLYLILGIAVARRRPRWLLVLVIVLVLVHVGGSFQFFAANLTHPESPLSFLTEALVLILGVATLVGAIVGLRGAAPGSRRPIGWAAAGLTAIALVVTLIAAGGTSSDARQDSDVVVTVERAAFPAQLAVPAGGAALWIDNRDPIHHTLVVEDTDVRVVLPASSAARAELDIAAGTYRYFCDVPGHESMEGELVVQ